MAKQQKPKSTAGNRNADRRNGKAAKKNPGVSASAHNGKTSHGYSAARLAAKAADADLTPSAYRDRLDALRPAKRAARAVARREVRAGASNHAVFAKYYV